MPSSSSATPPAVSVLMVVHNGAQFLAEAIDSVFAQSLVDFEFVVVDDGSTDATGAILEGYASRDSRMVVHRQANAGGSAARNRGFRLASAPLVANLDADDVALPTRLEQQHEFMTQHPAVGVVGGAVVFIDGSGREFGSWRYPLADSDIRRAFARSTPLAHPSTMIRRDAFFATGGYRRLLSAAQDVDLWLRIGERYELANVPEVVLRYRIHPGQVTVRKCEAGALGALAARIAARARAEGLPDPLDMLDALDSETLLRIGATREEVASAVVHQMTWVARTTGRAGYTADSERLFLEAQRRADRESRQLAANVHRQHARLHREQGRRIKSALESLRAARAGGG